MSEPLPRAVPSNASDDRRMIGGLCGLAYLILASYGVARPAIESLFLEVHGSRGLPTVWLAVALGAALAVTIYGRFARTTALPRLFAGVAAVSGGALLVLLGARAGGVPGASFLLYVWKDVYVVVLVEVFWSMASVAFRLQTARWAYGIFCVAGSLGGISANLVGGALSQRFGSAVSLWAVFPLLAGAWSVSAVPGMLGRDPPPTGRDAVAPLARATALDGSAAGTLLRSRYLVPMLLLICVVQIVITLIDYQFNAMVEATFPETDARTAAIGRVYAAIDATSIALQLLTGPILKLAGVSATLMAIPVLLGAAVTSFAAGPRLATIAIAKVAGKAFDYSLFRAAKELLYLPLSYAEKTQGKALVDILAYRVAKAGASLLLMALVAVEAVFATTFIALGAIAVWVALSVVLTRRYARLVRGGAAATPPP